MEDKNYTSKIIKFTSLFLNIEHVVFLSPLNSISRAAGSIKVLI